MQLGDINFAAQNAGNSFTVLQEICVVPHSQKLGARAPARLMAPEPSTPLARRLSRGVINSDCCLTQT